MGSTNEGGLWPGVIGLREDKGVTPHTVCYFGRINGKEEEFKTYEAAETWIRKEKNAL